MLICGPWEEKLVDPHAGGPTGFLLINVNLEGERIATLSGDGRNMIFMGVGKGDDFHDGSEEGLLHGTPDFGSLYEAHISEREHCRPRVEAKAYIPLSVLGSATVTLRVQLSQQTSSSPRDSQALRRRFSKNWMATWPRPPPLVAAWLPTPEERSASSWRSRAEARWSIMVSSSSSSTYGSVRSRTSRVRGVREGKKRVKKMVWRMPL